MNIRPWPLVFLAVLQFLTPPITILFNSIILGVDFSVMLLWVWQRPPLHFFETMFLMPIAGVAIYIMRKWSYYVFFVALGWSIVSNLRHWQYSVSTIPLPFLLLLYVGEALLVVYFLIPSVIATYLNPRVRWWVSRPRLRVELPSKLQFKEKMYSSELVNISVGGALIKTSHHFNPTDPIEVSFSILNQAFEIPARIIYTKTGSSSNEYWCGICFLHSKETEKKCRGLIQALTCLGFEDRLQRQSHLKELTDWAFKLITTGKGWKPESVTLNKKT